MTENHRREIVLMLVLIISLALVYISRSPSIASNEDGGTAATSAQVELAQLEARQLQTPNIEKALAARKAMWMKAESGMLDMQPPAALLATMSKTIVDLAIENGIELRQPIVSIDSSGQFIKVRARAAVRGDPESLVVFLQALSSQPQRIRMRAVQLSRSAATPSTVLAWSGTMELESLVRPRRP